MLSYAQNAEDVVLARALEDVEAGFYVDVGAASPDEASVTRHFYEAGWSGINVEPLPAWAAELRQVRTRDRNLELACSSTAGSRTIYRVIEDPALSTLDPELAAGYRSAGLSVTELRISVSTLDRILAEAAPDRIDFLKIDVEGAEAEVLEGLDLSRWRPRVILVEATRPTTLLPSFESFDHLLVSGRYVFAATDGINRYYAREEEAAELLPLLVPANSTDDYLPLREQLLAEEVSRLRVYVRHLERDLVIEKDAAEAARRELLAEIDGSTPSPTSWRSTSRLVSLDRIAVCTTPQTGGQQLLAALAESLGAPSLVAEHPADVPFAELDDRCVLGLTWGRSEQLRVLLSSNGFRVVTMVRHPLDTLLAYLRLAQIDRNTNRYLDGEGGSDDGLWQRSPGDAAFWSWAGGPRGRALVSVSSTWTTDPAVLKVHYEELVSDPDGALQGLLAIGGYEADAVTAAPKEGLPVDLEAVDGGWRRYLTPDAVTALWPSLEGLAASLGFGSTIDPSGLPSEAEATSNWQLLHDELRSHPDR